MLHRLVVSTLPLVPRPIMRRLASRYIAGERLDQAVQRLRDLAGRGYPGILDILGEHVREATAARAAAAAYRAAADAVAREGLDCYLSVKPTHVGLLVAEDLALELYDGLAACCAERGLFLRVEMEDHPTTDATLRIFETLRERHENVGCVLQARLFRTPADIDALRPGPLEVRVVKGVYLEPGKIAHTGADAIRDAFVEAARQLVERGARVAFATHDGPMSERLIRLVRERGLAPERYEFQVLLGVQEPLWQLWRSDGHPVRVYVPFGPEWRAYSTRRLAKNPQIMRHVIRDALTFGR